MTELERNLLELMEQRNTARDIAVHLEQENAHLTAIVERVTALATRYAERAKVPSFLIYAKDISKDLNAALAGDGS